MADELRAADGLLRRRANLRARLDTLPPKYAPLVREAMDLVDELDRATTDAWRFRDDFLSTLSHELRTPLNVVMGFAWRLRHSHLDTTARAHALEAIERNAAVLVRIVDNLLDISRLATGSVQLDSVHLDARRVIDEAVSAIGPAAGAKRVRVTVAQSGPVNVRGDHARLRQVFCHLLMNAVKFTPPGGRIDVQLERAHHAVSISVRDTGIGVTRELMPLLFDPFRQADSTPARAHGGLGLGLAIARDLVEAHGGTIEAESAGEGRGTTFRVRLPVGAPGAALERRRPRDGRIRMPALNGVRVLLTEGDPATRKRLAAQLGRLGAHVTIARTVHEAVKDALNERPDVILSDLRMPGGGAAAFLHQLRALEPRLREPIPAVAISPLSRAEDRVRALMDGFETCIGKPIDATELAFVIAKFANARHRRAMH